MADNWGTEAVTYDAQIVEAPEVNLFGKWSLQSVNVSDISLVDYIPVKEKSAKYLPHSAGRFQVRRFRKAACPIVERLANSLMMHGRNNGKKLMTVRIVKHAFEIIYLLTGENPVQVLVNAVINSGPREDSTRIGRAGTVRRQAVDVSPLRRVNQALWLLCTGAREAAFRNVKTIAECLADELINAAKGSSNSYAIKKKDELERVAKSNRHTNNWAVLVCTSKFWFNYRHVSNVLALYHSLKRLGIPDSNIIIMLAEDVPCNARNPRPGTVFAARAGVNLYGEDVEVDYRGDEVTVENFIRILTGRHQRDTPRSKRLLTDHQSNVLIYLTGHGGDSFMKFRDSEELTNVDLAYAIQTMYEDNRYHELLMIADSCRSASMFEWIASPNVISLSSSLTHEESYSHDIDPDIGVYVIDRYTHYTVSFLNKEVRALNSTAHMQDYIDSCPSVKCMSTTGVRRDNYPKDPNRVRVTDFFGSARIMQPLTEEIELDDSFWSM
ncbi:unnamed protein product [Caenorhabditis bovis]|uniref:Small ribosomal subunit protein uS7 domain-containing protein n=1 Tax=Caenorhabditis bovis TaxID=2654633 RepID=A0A8S1FEM7_9PELO|nr:unnamed protein product [Caenorhabditis bovis]